LKKNFDLDLITDSVKDVELAHIMELEKSAPDDLYGMRVHCWVLVLTGRREVGGVRRNCKPVDTRQADSYSSRENKRGVSWNKRPRPGVGFPPRTFTLLHVIVFRS